MLNEKLIKIQTELKAPKNQFNKFGGYSYRSCNDIMEALKPLLQANQVSILLNDELVMIGNRYYIKATASLQDDKEKITTTAYARESETKKGMDESQITGSASSYARKYALNGLFAIDDVKDADTRDNTLKPATEAVLKPTMATSDVFGLCPQCGGQLRQGIKNKNILYCANYKLKNCKYTQPITESKKVAQAPADLTLNF